MKTFNEFIELKEAGGMMQNMQQPQPNIGQPQPMGQQQPNMGQTQPMGQQQQQPNIRQQKRNAESDPNWIRLNDIQKRMSLAHPAGDSNVDLLGQALKNAKDNKDLSVIEPYVQQYFGGPGTQ